jgi:hypothetical protein
MLVDELGMEPSAELRELASRILRQDASLAAEVIGRIAKVGDLTAGMWRRKASLLPRFAKLGLDAPSGQAEA